MADTKSLFPSNVPNDAVADGPPPDAAMLARYPSLRPDGEFGPLQRRVPRPVPTAPDPQDPRWQAHQEAVAAERREALRLRNRYPSLDERTQMTPVPPDPADLRRYASSMPNGSVEQPRPTPTVAKPVTAPPVQPTTKPTTIPTTAPAAEAAPAKQGSPIDAAVELPAEYADLAVPENFDVDPSSFAPAAARMAEAGFTKQQAEVALQLHAAQLQAQDKAALEERRQWRAEAEQMLTPETRQSIDAAMASAPPEVRRLLDETALGDNPHVVRWIADLGRRLGGLADPAARRYPRTDWR
jgi:hypothetical protein